MLSVGLWRGWSYSAEQMIFICWWGKSIWLINMRNEMRNVIAQHCGAILCCNNTLVNFQFRLFFLWFLSHASKLFGKHITNVSALFSNFFLPDFSRFFKCFVACTFNSFSRKSSFSYACLAHLFFISFRNDGFSVLPSEEARDSGL